MFPKNLVFAKLASVASFKALSKSSVRLMTKSATMRFWLITNLKRSTINEVIKIPVITAIQVSVLTLLDCDLYHLNVNDDEPLNLFSKRN